MSSTSTEAYSTALTFFSRAHRSAPNLEKIARLTPGGILGTEWVRDPEMQEVLSNVKARHQEEFVWKAVGSAKGFLEREQERLQKRYKAIVSSRIFSALAELPRRMVEVLFIMSGDPELGGPNVLASHRVLLLTLEDVYGKRYSLKAITWAWKVLAEHGILTVTPGTAYRGFGKAQGTVYHLLPKSPDETYYTSPTPGGERACVVGVLSRDLVHAVRGAFRGAIERVRDLKRRLGAWKGHLSAALMAPSPPFPEWDFSEMLPDAA